MSPRTGCDIHCKSPHSRSHRPFC